MSLKQNNVFSLSMLLLLNFIPSIINAVFMDYRGLDQLDNIFIVLNFSVIFYILYINKLQILVILEKNNYLKKICIFILTFIIWLMISLIYRTFFLGFPITLEIKHTVIAILAQILFFSFIIIIKIFNQSDNSLIKCKLINLWLIISTFSILYNLLFKFEEFKKMLLPNASENLNLRSFFINRNYFGFFMFLSLVLLLRKNKSKESMELRSKTILFILIAIHLVFLFLSMSRNSFLAFLVFTIIYYLPEIKKRAFNVKTYKLLISIFISLLMGILIFTNINISRYLRLDNLFSNRLEIWKYTISIVDNNFLFGVNEFNLRQQLSMYFDKSIQPHNYYLNILAGYGIIGFIFLNIENVILIITTYKQKTDIDKLGVIAFSISILIYGFFETTSFIGIGIFPNLILFILLLL